MQQSSVISKNASMDPSASMWWLSHSSDSTPMHHSNSFHTTAAPMHHLNGLSYSAAHMQCSNTTTTTTQQRLNTNATIQQQHHASNNTNVHVTPQQ